MTAPYSDSKPGRRMAHIDAMPQGIRDLIHEEGFTVVDAFLVHGITKPRIIRHLINAVRAGSYNGGFNPLQRERVTLSRSAMPPADGVPAPKDTGTTEPLISGSVATLSASLLPAETHGPDAATAGTSVPASLSGARP